MQYKTEVIYSAIRTITTAKKIEQKANAMAATGYKLVTMTTEGTKIILVFLKDT